LGRLQPQAFGGRLLSLGGRRRRRSGFRLSGGLRCLFGGGRRRIRRHPAILGYAHDRRHARDGEAGEDEDWVLLVRWLFCHVPVP